MTLSELPIPTSGRLVYGDPYTAADGATVIPVSRVRGASSSPVGIYVIRDGAAVWTPAFDVNRVAMVGVATGFVAAALSCLAVLRRPPWPDTVVRIEKHR